MVHACTGRARLFPAMRFNTKLALQVYVLQYFLFCVCLENAIHSTEGKRRKWNNDSLASKREFLQQRVG
jgi:hypothetical protein